MINIVTIFDYDLKRYPKNSELINRLKIMLKMFIGGIKINCKANSYKIYIITDDKELIKNYLNEDFIETIQIKRNEDYAPNNVKNKLYNLCHLDFEFIYLDLDMYVNADLSFLWEKRKEKPFIATIHQKNIYGKNSCHIGEKNAFMNSGLQIVSDPSILNYNAIFNFGKKTNFAFPIKGTDQALLNEYFKSINYDFVHEKIGCEWNSCAGYGYVFKYNKKFKITYKNQDVIYTVKINHYWNEFKPWSINCPIFNYYENEI